MQYQIDISTLFYFAIPADTQGTDTMFNYKRLLCGFMVDQKGIQLISQGPIRRLLYICENQLFREKF